MLKTQNSAEIVYLCRPYEKSIMFCAFSFIVLSKSLQLANKYCNRLQIPLAGKRKSAHCRKKVAGINENNVFDFVASYKPLKTVDELFINGLMVRLKLYAKLFSILLS